MSVRKKSSAKSICKFVLFSAVMTVLLFWFMRRLGVLGNIILIKGHVIKGLSFSLLYAAFALIIALWFILGTGIKRSPWRKIMAVAAFPACSFVVLRIRLIVGFVIPFAFFFIIWMVLPSLYGYATDYMKIYDFDEDLHLSRAKRRKIVTREIMHDYIPGCMAFCVCWIVFFLMLNSDFLKTLKNYEEKVVLLEESFVASDGKYELSALAEEDMLGLMINHGPMIFAQGSKYVKGEPGKVWEANKKGLYDLKKDIYDNLSTGEKLIALQTLVDIESDYLLGKTGVIRLANGMTSEQVLGYYSDEYQTVVISDAAIEDRDQAIGVVLHEMKHAHQAGTVHYINNLGIMDNELIKHTEIARWNEEEINYITGEGENADLEGYFSQAIEANAYAYSLEWTEEYIAFIEGIKLGE